MTRATRAGAVVAGALLLLALGFAVRRRTVEQDPASAASAPAAVAPATTPTAVEGSQPGFLYGRVTTLAGAVYEGRLRWG
ncbi:hypothetical protein EG835_11455, partial [bacterium]|nr:hypothetical protein [bacterium]